MTKPLSGGARFTNCVIVQKRRNLLSMRDEDSDSATVVSITMNLLQHEPIAAIQAPELPVVS